MDAICTIISKNYLPFARVLAKSYREHNGGSIFVMLTDEIEGYFDPSEEPFEIIRREEVAIPESESFYFKYSILELNTAVKPYLIEYLFTRYKVDKLIYFDPDIMITSDLSVVFRSLDDHDVVITPHIMTPYNDDRHPSELEVLQSGTYNLGFVALRRNELMMRFIKWWQERLYDQCTVDIPRGLFVDQKWMDLLPALHNAFILKNPGYNVAYWNLHERNLDYVNGKWYSNGEPLVFFHFSGFNPENFEAVSKHQNRWSLKDLPHLKPLFETYARQVLENGYAEAKNWPYSYSFFDNGVRIPDIARKIYLYSTAKERAVFGNPFDTKRANSFTSWLNKITEVKNRDSLLPITNLLYAIYEARLDIKVALPNIFSQYSCDLPLLIDWFKTTGKHEFQLDDYFIEPFERRALG